MRKLTVSLVIAGIVAAATAPPSFTPGKAVGVATAPIKMEVFTDYQCPHCRQLFEETLKPLANDYISKGKIYLIHRDFPLPGPGFPRSHQAATYAAAAGRVNPMKFELVAGELFRRQREWGMDGKVDEAVAKVLSPEEIKKVRALLGDKNIAAEIDQDVALGTQANLRSTPLTLITYKGRVYPASGFISYPILRRFLDDLLSK